MGSLYVMRRANGDWFALDDRGCSRVPVFRSIRDGMLARVIHAGMLLFRPAALDEVALSDLKPAGGGAGIYFWLVDAPFTDLKRGRQVDHADLATLLHDQRRYAQGRGRSKR